MGGEGITWEKRRTVSVIDISKGRILWVINIRSRGGGVVLNNEEAGTKRKRETLIKKKKKKFAEQFKLKKGQRGGTGKGFGGWHGFSGGGRKMKQNRVLLLNQG